MKVPMEEEPETPGGTPDVAERVWLFHSTSIRAHMHVGGCLRKGSPCSVHS